MDPLELAQMGVQTLGNIFSGVMKGNSYLEQERALKQNALQAEQEAGVQSSEALMEGAATAGRAATQAAANGGGGGIAQSALGVISDLSSRAMFDARSAVYSGVTQANADLYSAKIAHENSINSYIGAGIGASGSMLGDVMKNQQQQRFYGYLQQKGGGSPLYDPSQLGGMF